MPCNPADNSLNPPRQPPPIPIPGFGIPSAPTQPPFPDFAFPEGFPEDMLELVNKLFLLFPSSKFQPNLDGAARTILDAVTSLLNQIAPFLSLYKFFLAALNLIMCIIDVLCSLPFPFKAMRRLFKRCLPNFMALFPWIALIAMILTLLQLLIALIRYIIATILAYIKEIIRNIQLLSDAVRYNDAERILAAARKIASLLCLIQNLFAILVAFSAILSIIQELAQIHGRGACQSDDTGGDDPGCCGDDVCPPFIRNNPDGSIESTTGHLTYFNQRPLNASILFPGFSIPLPPGRAESWQFLDEFHIPYSIKDIITPIQDNIYYPDGLTFDATSNKRKVPYFVDLKMFVDPKVFTNTQTDIKGARWILINGCVIASKPYVGAGTFNGGFDPAQDTGTAILAGGLVYEDDGYMTPVTDPYGNQLTFNTFIHQDPVFYPNTGGITIDDGYYINNINYTLRINQQALYSHSLVAIGCMPDITTERAVVNAQYIDQVQVALKIKFPNPGGLGPGTPPGTVECLQAALANFRKDVSLEGAALFQASTSTCLNTLLNDTTSAYSQAFNAGFSTYASTVTIDPAIQFVGSPIKVTITPKDANGTSIAFGIPSDLQNTFAQNMLGSPTFGSLNIQSDGYQFEYDGYQSFVGTLTSLQPGSGTFGAFYNGAQLSTILNRSSDTTPSQIVPIALPYTFVGRLEGIIEPPVRRDESDVARDDER